MTREEVNAKIEELQVLESQLQNFLAQKQAVQIEINEVDNALNELKDSGEEVYKIVSGFMIKTNKEKLEEELKDKKKFLDMKLKSMEKQEKLIESDASKLRAEVNKMISDENKK